MLRRSRSDPLEARTVVLQDRNREVAKRDHLGGPPLLTFARRVRSMGVMTDYQQGLGKTPANSAPLTPISFLQRAAAVYPDKIAVIHGARTIPATATFHDAPAACLRARRPRHRQGRHRGDHGAQRAGHAGSALRRAHAGRGAQRPQHPPGRATIAFILEHGEAKVLITDREFSGVIKDGPGRDSKKPPLVIDIDDPNWPRAGELLGELDYEAFLAEGEAGLRGRPAGRRMAVDLPALHLGHHRQPQGRGLSSPRRLPERGRQHDHLRARSGRRSTSGPCRCSTATAGPSPGR